MKHYQKGFTIVEGFGLVWIAFVVAVLVGWVMNIVQLIHLSGTATLTLGIILRIVGIFVPPLGAIMGYFG